MTAELHAARLAEALRNMLDPEVLRDYVAGNMWAVSNVQDARAALAAWDRRNAAPPKQESLL